MTHVRFTTKDTRSSSLVPLVIFIEQSHAEWFGAHRDDLVAELNSLLCDVMEDIYANHTSREADAKQQLQQHSVSRLPSKLAIVGYCTSKRPHYEIVTVDPVGNDNIDENIVPFQLRVWLYPPDAEASDILPIFLT